MNQKLARAERALETLRAYNQLRNDRDAYLLAVIRWGLGEEAEEPKPEDYGLKESEGNNA